LAADGAKVTDEDSLAKAMRRKAASNLDAAGIVSSDKPFFFFFHAADFFQVE
jgi:hypothetical protein